MSDNAVARPERANWNVNIVRFTAFTAPEVEQGLDWRSFIGRSPASTRNEAELTHEVGAFEGGQLVLERRPGRIDFIHVGDDSSSKVIPSLGLFPQATQTLRSYAPTWAEKLGDIGRIAFGLQLFERQESVQAANARLLRLIPNAQIPIENVTDFLLQLNVPNPSAKIDGLVINRLSKLLVHRIQTMSVSGGRLRATQETIASGWELDINTAPDFEGSFSGDLFRDAFEELTLLAEEIVDNGIPGS